MKGAKKNKKSNIIRKYLLTFMIIPFSLIALIGFGAYQYLMEEEEEVEVVPITITKTTVSTTTRTTPKPTVTEATPVRTTTGTSESISAAPKQIFLKKPSIENFNFWGHDVIVRNYGIRWLAGGGAFHEVDIIIDGNMDMFSQSLYETCTDCAYSRTSGGITYLIRPVIWKTNEAGEKIWSFDTWNTEELYFEMVKS